MGLVAELPSAVRQYDGGSGSVRFESRQHLIVHQVDRGDRNLVWVYPSPSVARAAVDAVCGYYFAHAVEMPTSPQAQQQEERFMWIQSAAFTARIDLNCAIKLSE